jgi:hypothetical protein
LKRKTFVIFLLALTILASMIVISPTLAKPAQQGIIRLDAKGGIPGAPGGGKPSEPPDEDPVTYELTIEIDFLTDHAPSWDSVNYDIFDYITDYYNDRGITIKFDIDEEITTEELVDLDIDASDGINDSEFWKLESQFNQGLDNANDGLDEDNDGYDAEFFLNKKWVLYGTTVEGESNIMGYTLSLYLMRNPKRIDLLAGNYIYIADEATDNEAIEMGVADSDAEAVVLMHELGHSVGIGILAYNPLIGVYEAYD